MTQGWITRDFNFGWKFSLGETADAHAVDFDDAAWRVVRLPHDWSVEFAFTQEGTGGSTAFLPGGIGWYRKTFRMPAERAADGVTWIEFDGVYNNSEVWINGHALGKRPYGYVPFSYDLTPYLHYGDTDNVIAVRVNRSAYIDCRWYPGSGIYRNVKLVTAGRVHVPQYGVTVTTPVVTTAQAEVVARTSVVNSRDTATGVTIKTTLHTADGKLVAEAQTVLNLNAGDRGEALQRFDIPDPWLWDTESPHLYTAESTLLADDMVCDAADTTFGIRELRFDPDTGFYLNGINTPFKGVCLHHDGGCVGAAVPVGVWERRLKLLKEAGCNAIRTAHNPPAAEFLDLCDRMGFLVQDEAFDEWTNPKDKRHNYNQLAEEAVTRGYTHHFEAWAEADVKAMVRRDRNHPCVIMWSIGNEIEWTYPRYQVAAGYWDEGRDRMDYYYDLPPYDSDTIKARWAATEPGEHELAPIAQALSGWIKELDATRPVTANLVIPCVGHFSGFTDALDIVGYSYRQVMYDYGHELYPEKMIFGSENWGQWHEWKPAAERDFIPGIFLWTGIDYLGESRNWPTKGSGSGLLDFAGFKHPRYHMFRALWDDTPYVYAATSRDDADAPYEELHDGQIVHKKRNEKWMPMWGWQAVNEHWNYDAGDDVFVEVYTNCPEVELFVNGESAGTKLLADFEDYIIKWRVPYAAGKITAVGHSDSDTVRHSLTTAKTVAAIELSIDKHALRPNAYDVAHIVAQLVDADGAPVRTDDREVVFSVPGTCRLLGVDNGWTDSVQAYQSNRCMTHEGRCLLIIQAKSETGTVMVSAESTGLQGDVVTLTLT